MPTVRCINPACGRDVPLPAGAPPGKVYGCPHCKERLPPAPGAPVAWVLCLVATVLIVLADVAATAGSVGSFDPGAQLLASARVAAAGAQAAFAVLALYVFVRAAEHVRRRD
jgi:hypothetical protein